MKKLLNIACILFITISHINSQNTKEIGDNGFYLNIGVFKPNYDFFIPKSMDFEKSDFNKDELFGFGPCLEIGNYFKLKNFDAHSLQLKVAWFDANYSNFKYKFDKKMIYDINDDILYETYDSGNIPNNHNTRDSLIVETITNHLFQGSILKIGPNFTNLLPC